MGVSLFHEESGSVRYRWGNGAYWGRLMENLSEWNRL
jgi:hypothetical protein